MAVHVRSCSEEVIHWTCALAEIETKMLCFDKGPIVFAPVAIDATAKVAIPVAVETFLQIS